jgi:transposase InsO family protein
MKGAHEIKLLCSVLQVARSGYYRWRRHLPGRRRIEDAELSRQIAQAHKKSRGTYGVPRIVAELRANGTPISRRRCGRLMRSLGLRGRKRCGRRPRTTDSRHDHPIAQNHLKNQAAPSGLDQVWITDITYLRTGEGWLYLAAILDAWSRRVIGWSSALTLHASLVLAAFSDALGRRRPPVGVFHHSDRGSQFAQEEYRKALKVAGMIPSMSRAGNCYDNATMESFWSSFKVESGLAENIPATRHRAHLAVFDYIETFYNPVRRHSSLGMISPVAFEKQHQKHISQAA